MPEIFFDKRISISTPLPRKIQGSSHERVGGDFVVRRKYKLRYTGTAIGIIKTVQAIRGAQRHNFPVAVQHARKNSTIPRRAQAAAGNRGRPPRRCRGTGRFSGSLRTTLRPSQTRHKAESQEGMTYQSILP